MSDNVGGRRDGWACRRDGGRDHHPAVGLAGRVARSRRVLFRVPLAGMDAAEPQGRADPAADRSENIQPSPETSVLRTSPPLAPDPCGPAVLAIVAVASEILEMCRSEKCDRQTIVAMLLLIRAPDGFARLRPSDGCRAAPHTAARSVNIMNGSEQFSPSACQSGFVIGLQVRQNSRLVTGARLIASAEPPYRVRHSG